MIGEIVLHGSVTFLLLDSSGLDMDQWQWWVFAIVLNLLMSI